MVYLDPVVYESRTAQCPPPCTFILPPVPLASATTIFMDPYTTSLEVGSSVNGVFSATTTTVTVVVQSIVTDKLPQSNVVIANGQATGAFDPAVSVDIPPSTVLVTNGAGQTSSRVIVFPPWPVLAYGPVLPPVSVPGGSSAPTTTSTGTVSVRPPRTWTEPAYNRPPIVFLCGDNDEVHYVAEYNAYVTLADCPGAATTMVRDCAPTKTVEIEGETTQSFTLGCTLFLFTGTGTRVTDGPLPTYTTWPEGELVWEEEDDGDNSGKKSTCRLWLFFICINWSDVKLGGWRWRFPPGIYPPGPPPSIRWPPRVSVKGVLPGPWPPVTIGWDDKVTYPALRSGQCTTQTADVCSTTTTLDIKTTGNVTTTSTLTQSTCTTILGCKVEDDDWETTTTVSCSRTTITTDRPGNNVARAVATATQAPSSQHQPLRSSHEDDEDPNVCFPAYDGDAIIFPTDPENVGALVGYLEATMQNGLPLWSATIPITASNGAGYQYTSMLFTAGLDTDIFNAMWQAKMTLGVSARRLSTVRGMNTDTT